MFGCILQNVAAECEKKIYDSSFREELKTFSGDIKKTGGGLFPSRM